MKKEFLKNQKTALLLGLSALFVASSAIAVGTTVANGTSFPMAITANAETRSVTFAAKSISLGDYIGIRFYFNGLQAGDTATFTCNGNTVENVAYQSDNNGNYFEYYGLTAKMLQTQVTCTVKNGESELATHTENATNYLIGDFNNQTDSFSGTAKILVSDILHYGAAAEVYSNSNNNGAIEQYMTNYGFAFDASEVATTYDAENKTYTDQNGNVVCALTGEANAAIKWNTVTLNLDNMVNVVFTGTVTGDDYSIEISDASGVIKTVAAKAGENTVSVPVYFVDICDGVYTAKLVDSQGEQVGQAFTYSVMKYVESKIQTEGAVAELAKSIWQLGKSASIYQAMSGGEFNVNISNGDVYENATAVATATDGTLSYEIEGEKSAEGIMHQGQKECIGGGIGFTFSFTANGKTYASDAECQTGESIVSGIYYNGKFVSDYEMYTYDESTNNTEGVTYDKESNTYTVTAAPTTDIIVSVYNANVVLAADLKDVCIESYEGTIGNITVQSGTVDKLTISAGAEDKTVHTLTNGGTVTWLDATSGVINIPSAMTMDKLTIVGDNADITINGALTTNNLGVAKGALTVNGNVKANKLFTTGGTFNVNSSNGNAITANGGNVYYYLVGGTINLSHGSGDATAIDVAADKHLFVLGAAIKINFKGYVNDIWTYRDGNKVYVNVVSETNISTDSNYKYGEIGNIRTNTTKESNHQWLGIGYEDWGVSGDTKVNDTTNYNIGSDQYWNLIGWSGIPWKNSEVDGVRVFDGGYQINTTFNFDLINNAG